MSARDEINDIRIVKVTKNGKENGFSSLCDKLSHISPNGFVAIDSEFSGMGSDRDLKDDNLQVRYSALRKLADTRAILSVGVAVFDVVREDAGMADLELASADTETSESDTKPSSPIRYEVAIYDMLMSCQSEFSMSADAGEFLVAHAFDFNEMFRKGIPYERASTEKPREKSESGKDKSLSWQWGKMPRGLLWRIGRQAVPLIVHNGLYDLVFLFAAFQGPLPESLNDFVSALLECVPAGYWDSKVLASSAQERTSFLSYLFAKSVLGGKVSVRNSGALPSAEATDPKEPPTELATDDLCALYAFRGFCPRGLACPFQHDPFKAVEEEINGKSPKDKKEAYNRHKVQSKGLKRQKTALKAELSKMSKKQRKKFLATKAASVESVENHASDGHPQKSANGKHACDRTQGHSEQTEEIVLDKMKKAHTAGWDAFCTGYAFAAYRESLPSVKLNKVRNQIALPYKLSALLLCRSRFADLDKHAPDADKDESETISTPDKSNENSAPLGN